MLLRYLTQANSHSVAFAGAACNALVNGGSKKRNIILVDPANCGKRFLLPPQQHMFKTFPNPSNDKYTWQEAEDCEAMFLNNFKWTPQMIP